MKTRREDEAAASEAARKLTGMAVYWQISALVGLAFLESFSYGIVSPMLPIVVTEYFAREHAHGDPINCGRHSHDLACIEGSKDAAWWSSVISSVGAFGVFLLSSTLGQASDSYGRKPFIVTSQVLHMWFPFTVIYFVEGAGSIVPYFVLHLITIAFATSGVGSAAISDLVSRENRAVAFGILIAAYTIGYCVSAGFAGFFSRTQALIISSVLSVTRVLWSIFIYPETLPESKRARKPRRRCRHPIRGMTILWRSPLFIRLTILIALTTFVGNGAYQIRMFYLNTVIGFDEKDISQLMLFFGVGAIFAQSLLLKPLMSCGRERGVIVAALMGRIIEYGGYAASAYVPEKWVIFAATAPGCLGELSFAAIGSLKSINCTDREQGRLQGAIYSARAVFDATGPIVYAYLYKRMTPDAKWTMVFPFAISIVLYIVSVGLAATLPVKTTESAPSTPIPFSPLTAPAPSPTCTSSGIGTVDFDFDDDEDAEEDVGALVEDDMNEPLLSDFNETNPGVGSV